MSDKYYRSAYMNVDLNAVASNFKVFSTLHPNKTVMAVVKANAYGLGSVKVARHLMENGATFFAVATLDEAIELRMHGITAKILVLGVLPAKDIDKAIQHRVALTVPSKQWLKEAIKNISGEQEKKLWLHIKLDTGMGRLGIKDTKTYQEVIEIIQQYEQLV
ncbi:alanine racemase, partial [Staphylococcus aureus]